MNPSIPEPEVLERDVRAVRALARRLVREADADDLAQEAWRISLERGDAPRDAGTFRGGIARRLAANLRRAGKRRERREALAAREERAPSAAAVAERVEQHRRVVDAVLALAEPYREAVLLRFFEGLPPRSVARRLGAPVATIHSRLARALALLRSALAERAGGRTAWLAGILPLARFTVREALAWGGIMKAKIAAAALLVAVLGWWWLRPLPPGPTLSEATPVTQASAAPAPASEASTDPIPASVVDARAFREPSEAMPGYQEGLGTVRIRVIEAESGRPIAGAEVFVFDSHAPLADPALKRRVDRFRFESAGGASLTSKFGARTESDDDGVARVPGWRGGAMFTGLTSDRFGASGETSARSGGEIELKLYREAEPFRVRVVDSAGRPLVGIPVSLRYVDRQGDAKSGVREDRYDTQVTLTEAPDGFATLKCYWQAIAERPNLQVRAAIALPLAEPVEWPVQPDAARPAEPITLTCPPLGSVLVRVTGTPAPAADAPIQLYVRGTTHDGYRWLRAICRDRAARFPLVGLGLSLEVHASPDFGLAGRSVTFEGPHVAVERVEVEVPLIPRRRSVSGRLLFDDGQPMAWHSLLLRPVEAGASRASIFETMSDAGGRFTLPLVDYDDERFGGRFRAEPSPREEVLATEIDIPTEGDEVDLGVIIFRRKVVVARGVVVDAAGRPVKDVRVLLKTSDDPEPYKDSDGRIARSDEDEAFIVYRDEAPAGPLWVQASGRGAQPARSRPVAVDGPGPYRLVLDEDTTLEGRLIAPPGFPIETAWVAIWNLERAPPGRHDLGGGWQYMNPGPDGRVRFAGLKPGRYQLAVAGTGMDVCEIVLDELVVRPGANRDPRFDALDIGATLRAIRVTATDETGRPVDAECHAAFANGRIVTGGRSGKAFTITNRPLTAILVSAEGFFPAGAVPAADGTCEVRLTRGVALSLQWPEGVALPAGSFQVFAWLEPSIGADADQPGVRHVRSWLERNSPARGAISATGIASLRAPGAGTFRVKLMLQHSTKARVQWAEISPDPKQEIAVAGSVPLHGVLAVDAARLAEACRELEGR